MSKISILLDAQRRIDKANKEIRRRIQKEKRTEEKILIKALARVHSSKSES